MSSRRPLSQRAVEAALFASGTATKLRKLARGQAAGERIMSNARAAFYVRVWTEAAESLSLPLDVVDGSLVSIFTGERRLLVRANVTSLDDVLTVEISEAKALVNRLLAARSIPTPRHIRCRFSEIGRAWEFMSHIGGPSVVKPATHGIGGYGVTTGVRTRKQLAWALSHARSVEAQVVVEELVDGDVYRLLYLDGELMDAVLRAPACLTADGTSSIRQLVARENFDRLQAGIDAAQELLRVDRDMRQSLIEQGYSLGSVPPAAQRVRLKRVANDNRRQDNAPALGAICPEIVRSGAVAAATVGLRYAGVDIITKDPGRPLESNGGAVLEVNHGPGLYYHYMNAGPGTPVAKMVLEQLQKRPW